MRTTASKIERIYDSVKARKRDGHKDLVTITGLPGKHVFARDRLGKFFIDILSAIKQLPKGMRYSTSHTGMAWIYARHHHTAGTLGIDVAEELVAMGIALGIMRPVGNKCPQTDILYVVIDDERVRRHEAMKPKEERRRAVMYW